MKQRVIPPAVWGILLGVGQLFCSGALFPQSEPATLARQILDATGVRGGLIVHLGCGNGELTAELRATDSYLVHGLDVDSQRVRRARSHIQERGRYGTVSVDKLTGSSLPYNDNLVNLVVSEDPGTISGDEILRVLAPGGVAYLKKGEKWVKTVKPRPAEIDEWTHYLHDSTGNPVAHDSVVGPPRRLQWVGSPQWSRHHDRMASMNALVSSGGRIFYIIDEGAMASIQLPAKRALVARDAFNGTILWKRAVPTWHTQLWPFKSGPTQLTRRLVAEGNRVYVTLGIEAPLSVLDAASGETILTYKDSQGTEEVILSEGLLFLLVNETPVKLNDKYRPENPNVGRERGRVATEFPWNSKERKLTAVRAATGEILWRKSQRVVPTTLAANRDRLLFHDGEKVVCLNRENGDELWTSKPVERRRSIPTSFAPNLIVYQSVVLFSGGNRSMTALSATTGETLWTADHARSGHNSPEDLLVVGGLVWSGATAAGKDTGVFTGRDLKTGEIKREFPPDVSTHWFHQRCYRSKATDQYLLPSRTGIEFVDHEKKHWIPHHWVRGGCMYGIMPCNGLVYTPPHSCACYLDAKLSGFCALAPASSPPPAVSEEDRLERGPAYGQAVQSSPAASDRDWPTYRHDAARSGRTAGTVSAKLKQAWQVDLGGKLSSVVIAGGKVFVASVDTHTVHALDADSGTTLWSYTTGGRVDSPPTIHQGRAIFGSADGWVTCLRASDGELIWRFRAAPRDRRLVSFEQLESVWPVSGSVLIQNDRVYFVAGRSMFLDGGLRLCQLDPKTGRKISETVLDDRDPESGGNLQVKVKTLNMPTALPDVLSGDGRHVYMRTQRFDLQGQRQEIGPLDVTKQKGEGVHLFSPAGFLDGSWFHRSFFVYGKSIASGAGGWFKAGRNAPAGRLLVFDDSSVYGYGRKPQYFKWSTPLEYHLFATNKSPEIIKLEQTPAAKEPEKEKQAQRRRRRTGSSAAPRTQVDYKWSRPASVHAMGLVLAGETLFLAGPPDILDEEDAIKRSGDRELRSKLEAQARAFEGKSGAFLWAVSRANGQKLAEYKLDDPPVWDGMAAANGSLYLSTTGGKVLRMSSE